MVEVAATSGATVVTVVASATRVVVMTAAPLIEFTANANNSSKAADALVANDETDDMLLRRARDLKCAPGERRSSEPEVEAAAAAT